MGKVTKIMLILNILAGGAGIFFGMGIKGDLKTAEEAKGKAEADAQAAKGGTSKLESDNQKLSNDIQTLQGQFAKATNDLGAAQSTLASLQGGQGQMAADLQKAQQDNAQLQSQLAAAQTLANQTQKLKGDIAAYEAFGTPQEIRTRLDKLAKMESDAAAKKKKAKDDSKKNPKNNTPAPGAEVGSVASFDPKFGFAVLNRGASHGIKVGDVFRVTRNGQLVGKVTVQKADPTTAIANPIKQFTREPLKAGDKIVKDS
tara:strand:- start:932 stop:1705 length:774 start_codon:yes stop_codon:yes gene_type:complete